MKVLLKLLRFSFVYVLFSRKNESRDITFRGDFGGGFSSSQYENQAFESEDNRIKRNRKEPY